MSDNKELRGTPDRNRVSANQTYEVERLASKFGLSDQVVIDAIKKHGPMRTDIEKHLESLRTT